MTATAPAPGASVGFGGVTIPAVDGNADSVRALASAYENLSATITGKVRDARTEVDDLSRHWIGQAQLASITSINDLESAATQLVRNLDTTAQSLSSYADKLSAAQRSHGWSLKRIAEVGGVVVATGAVAVATAGTGSAAAGEADAAVISDAAADAAAAAAAGDAAAEAAGEDLAVTSRAMFVLRPIIRFVTPHLISAELNAGGTVLADVITSRPVTGEDLEGSAVVGFVGSIVGDDLTEGLGPYLSASPAIVDDLSRPGIQALTWGGASGLQDLIEGKPLRLSDVLQGAAFAVVTSETLEAAEAIHAARHADIDIEHDERAQAVRIARQLLAGDPRLDVHESNGGHVLGKHVDADLAETIARLHGTRSVRFSSVFHDRLTADASIAQALVENRSKIESWLQGGDGRLVLTSRYRDGSAGLVFAHADGVATHVERIKIVLDRRDGRPRITTAYPLFTDPNMAANAALRKLESR